MFVLIVPLWNWNDKGGDPEEFKNSSNCTFMELKWWEEWKLSVYRWVLIVPLWNWNMKELERKYIAYLSSNCTFMELK